MARNCVCPPRRVVWRQRSSRLPQRFDQHGFNGMAKRSHPSLGRTASLIALASASHAVSQASTQPQTLAKSADRHSARHQCGDRVAASGVEAVTAWHRHHGFEHSPRDGVVGGSTGRRPSTRSWSVRITPGRERHCLGRSLLTRGTGQRPSTVQPLTKHS